MRGSNDLFVIVAIGLTVFLSNSGFSGFEIGNGRKLIKNNDGGYSIVLPDKLEVGLSKRFTEVIAPLAEGTPRARLQINVVQATQLRSVADLVDSQKEGSWTSIKLAGLEGIKKEEVLPTRLTQTEIRLFLKAGEIIVINLEGVPSPLPVTAFEGMKDSLDSFQLNK